MQGELFHSSMYFFSTGILSFESRHKSTLDIKQLQTDMHPEASMDASVCTADTHLESGICVSVLQINTAPRTLRKSRVPEHLFHAYGGRKKYIQ
jgi:hypothetical protein